MILSKFGGKVNLLRSHTRARALEKTNKWLVSMSAAAVAAGAMAVESQNIVGYEDKGATTPRTLSVTFQGIGNSGTSTSLADILDASRVVDYSDTVEVYDAESGSFTAYQWDTATWFNASTNEPADILVVPGNSFIVTTEDTWRFSGEVAADGYEHPLDEAGVTLVGSAYPVETTLGNYDWSGIADYDETLEIYDAESGSFTAYQWDTETWFNASTDEPISLTTRADDGFLLTTVLPSVTQYIVPVSNE